MSVRLSLLAILDQGPCYGYQLRSEFDRRTGSTWPLNVGQIYNTLDRLERDGLVTRGDVDAQGHVFWHITATGSAEVAEWLAHPVERPSGTRDELAVKVALAATLPGVDVAPVIAAQRRATQLRLDALRAEEAPASDLAAEVLRDAVIFAAEAELRWLERTADRVAQHPGAALGLALAADAPKRGRPARVPDAAVTPAG